MILEKVEFDDLRRIMSTCRELYNSGLPLMLKDVSLMDHRQAALYRCYLATDPARCTHIKVFECRYSNIVPECSESRTILSFNEFLPHMTSLVELSIKFDRHDTLLAPCVIIWIGTLSRLRRVKLSGLVAPDIDTLKVLWQLPPSLELLHVKKFIDGPSVPQPVPLLPELRRFASSLRELLLRWEYLSPDIRRAGVQFPHVTSLEWSTPREVDASRIGRIVDVGLLVDAFPNLERLSFPPTIIEFALQEEDMIPIEENRLKNRYIQRTKCLSSLKSLHGEANFLYILGLECPVAYIGIFAYSFWTRPQYASWVFLDARPTMIEVNIEFGPSSIWPLSKVLPTEHLEELILDLRPSSVCHNDACLPDAGAGLASSQTVSYRYIHIRLTGFTRNQCSHR